MCEKKVTVRLNNKLYKSAIRPSSPPFYSHFYVRSMYGDIHVARSYTSSARQSLLFDITLYFVQSSSLRSSSLHSPLYFHFHCFPSYVVFLSSHHMPIPLQPPFLDFLCDSPTFVVALILSFLLLYSLVTPHIHRSILISATSNFISCAFFNAHVSALYISAGLTTVLYTFPLIFRFILLSHNTPDTLFQFFNPLYTLGDFCIQLSILCQY